MPFEKGQSGNPGGRPRKSDEQIKFERRCREWSDTLGFDKLRRWADCDDAGKSLEALKEIFNRGFGKSVETAIIDANVTAQTGDSAEALAGELAALVGRPASEGGGDSDEAKVDPGE